MGRRNPQEAGLRRQVTRRVGIQDFRLRGMDLRGDPGSIDPNRFRMLINVDFNANGDIRNRPGLTRVTPNPLDSATACVIDLADFDPSPGLKMYVVFAGCPNQSAVNGYSLNWYDNDQGLPFSRGLYYPSASALMVLGGPLGGRLYLSEVDKLKAFTLIVPHYQDESLAVAGVEQAEEIATFPGFTISALDYFDGKLFIGLSLGVGTSKVAVYDGVTVHDGTHGTTADLTGIDPPARFSRFRDKLVLGLSTTGLRVRSVGNPPGSWASFGSIYPTKELQSYHDILYGTTGSNVIWSFNETAVSAARTLTAGFQAWGLTEYFDTLFFGYQDNTPKGWLGKFDGAWTDAHHDFSLEDAGARIPRALVGYRGRLVAAVNTAAQGGKLFFSEGEDTGAGTYEVVVPASANNGAIAQLLVA